MDLAQVVTALRRGEGSDSIVITAKSFFKFFGKMPFPNQIWVL
jgi:hypothetical protein